jgi:hypothetical protein
MGEVFRVPVTKAKGFVEVDTGDLPDHVYKAIFAEGLKVFVNRGMTKITVKDLEGEHLEKAKAAALAKAQENVENLKAGKVRITGGAKANKVSGKVMTEARRIAKALIKEELKRQKKKISHIEPKEITAAANALIEANPEIIEQAKAAIEAQEQEVSKLKIDISSIKESEKLVARETKKAGTLSAAQAGKPAKRKGAQATA